MTSKPALPGRQHMSSSIPKFWADCTLDCLCSRQDQCMIGNCMQILSHPPVKETGSRQGASRRICCLHKVIEIEIVSCGLVTNRDTKRHRGRVVKAMDLKSIGISRTGSNPVGDALFCAFYVPPCVYYICHHRQGHVGSSPEPLERVPCIPGSLTEITPTRAAATSITCKIIY